MTPIHDPDAPAVARPAGALSQVLPDDAATIALGGALAAAVQALRPSALLVYLEGDLGAGKTTLVRGLLRALGHTGPVPSPTYTLVEPYGLAGYRVLHTDLYRLSDPGELDHLGLADELGPGSLVLVEWPGRAGGRLPPPDLFLTLARIPGGGRTARLEPRSPAGAEVLSAMGLAH